MSPGQSYLDDVVVDFRKQKEMADRAIVQIDDDAFFRKPDEQSNSVALIVKHLAGNLASRWTDFLTTDGEKPARDRDGEFVIGPDDSRVKLDADWERSWGILFAALAGLEEADLLRQVAIRGEGHTVLQAIQRSLTHAAYHVGQILYLARLVKGHGWQWITVAPGQSRPFEK